MECVGIDYCSKKTCLEQEKCVNDINRHIEIYISLKKTAPCQIHKEFCYHKIACEVLGQCIFEHPLVKADKTAINQLRKPCGLPKVVKIISRLKPKVKKVGKYRKTNR